MPDDSELPDGGPHEDSELDASTVVVGDGAFERDHDIVLSGNEVYDNIRSL